MSIRRSVLLCSLFALVTITGCAKPTYVEGGGNGGGANKPGTDSITCDATFTTSRTCVLLTWIRKPTEKAVGEFSFRAFQFDPNDGFPIAVDLAVTPEVQLWMPSMGHGSSPVKVTARPGGSYIATEVFFIMPGEWQIKIQIKKDNVVNDEAVLDYVF